MHKISSKSMELYEWYQFEEYLIIKQNNNSVISDQTWLTATVKGVKPDTSSRKDSSKLDQFISQELLQPTELVITLMLSLMVQSTRVCHTNIIMVEPGQSSTSILDLLEWLLINKWETELFPKDSILESNILDNHHAEKLLLLGYNKMTKRKLKLTNKEREFPQRELLRLQLEQSILLNQIFNSLTPSFLLKLYDPSKI